MASRTHSCHTSTMEFLMTDGTWRILPDIFSAEVEQGMLVCRNTAGDIVKTFARGEVAAFGDHLQLKDERGNRRSGGRAVDRT